MPIPKNVKDTEMLGREVTLDAGMDKLLRTTLVDVELPKGTRFHVSGTSKGLDISTEKCRRCGMSVKATGIDRRMLSIADENAKGPEPEAFWTSQEEKNDYLWARCSMCGFTVEALRAVRTGSSSNDYRDAKYKYCPRCGRRMGVMGIDQKKARKADG